MGCAGSGTRGRGDKKAPGLAGAVSEAGWWRMRGWARKGKGPAGKAGDGQEEGWCPGGRGLAGAARGRKRPPGEPLRLRCGPCGAAGARTLLCLEVEQAVKRYVRPEEKDHKVVSLTERTDEQDRAECKGLPVVA